VDEERVLSPEASAEPGKWYTSRAEYQRGIMDAFSDDNIETVVVMTSSQVGKALAIDTPIITLNGWKTIKDIQPGDIVFGSNGNPAEVLATSPIMNDRPCYEITFDDGEIIIADADHKWVVFHRNLPHKKRIVTTSEMAKDVSKGNTNFWRIQVAGALNYPQKKLLIDPYILGVWLGDGNSFSAQVTVDGRDELLHILLERGESLPSVGRQPYKTHGMHQKLSQLNLINNKHIPEEYLTASIEQRKALLQGIFDTDGYVSKNGIAEITFSSKRLAYDVVELLRTLGIKPFIKEKKIVYNGADRKVWKITFVAYKEDEICLMPRKKARLKSMSDHNVRITEARRRSIISIKQIESVPVKCLAVDSEDKTFLVGKHLIPTHNTEMLLNIAGYYIDKEPCSILVIQPTLEMAKAWSKERLAPMLRDSPCFRGKVHDVKTRNPEETILLKNFPGGFIAIAGANSPASLAARPIRLLLCDEVDRYPISAGVEGDPVDLARKRTTTFWNRKIGLFSTPTIKDASRIELAYELSDKRKFYVPCLKCGFEQVLDFSNLKWEENNPETARYVCPQCGTKINDADKIKMLKRGRWIPERETGKIAGFWLNELYSSWVSFSNLVQRYIEAKKSKETMKVFINTSLGLPYEEEGEQIEENKLFAKREAYDIVPAGVGVLTCAVDVQEDRLECLVVGWGKDEEAWHIEHKILYGNTATEEVWQQLDAYLQKTFMHETGALLKIAICVIDAGYMTKKVYDFVKPRQTRRVYAIKGSQTAGAPIVGRPRTVGKQKVKLFMIGTTTAKDIIFSRLKLEKPGPGYMHFNMQCDEEYFLQLTAEKAVYRLIRGFAVKEYIKVRPRNEILDLWVYSLAAHTLLNPNIDKILKELAQNQSKKAQNEAKSALNQSKTLENEPKSIENKPKPHFRRFRTSSWVKGW